MIIKFTLKMDGFISVKTQLKNKQEILEYSIVKLNAIISL